MTDFREPPRTMRAAGHIHPASPLPVLASGLVREPDRCAVDLDDGGTRITSRRVPHERIQHLIALDAHVIHEPGDATDEQGHVGCDCRPHRNRVLPEVEEPGVLTAVAAVCEMATPPLRPVAA